MKLFARLLVVMTLSVAIASGLSKLPDIQQGTPGASGELTVFRVMNPISLTDDNLVDWMMEMPTKLEMTRVDWSHRMLALDFRVDDKMSEPRYVYSQLLDSVRYGLVGTRNVERVQIRVFDPAAQGDGVRRLLVALDAQRNQYNEDDYLKWRKSNESAESWLAERFQLTRTTLWKERLSK